jgi:hypothetical protein
MVPCVIGIVVVITASTCAANKIPKGVYVDESPMAAINVQEEDRGFMVFSRNYVRVLPENANPTVAERVTELSASACPGEYEPVILVIRALRDLQQVRVSVTDLAGNGDTISASAIDVRSVRYHPKQGQRRWGRFNEPLMEVPLFLEKRESVSVAADRNQPFWLTVHVPEKALPGTYTGRASVSTDRADPVEVPLTIEVHPFKLDKPKGMCFGMYTRLRSDPAIIRETFADMRAHGMTSIGLCGNSGLTMTAEDGKIVIDWNGQSLLEKNMKAYVQAAFPEPMVWLMGGDIPRFCEKIAPIKTDEFADLYCQVIRQINMYGKQSGWPEIIYQPIDEPFEHADRLERAMRLLRLLKSIPGVRTENDGMNGRWENFTDECYHLTDVMALHDGPTLHRGQLDMNEWWRFYDKSVALGKRIWFYNIDLTAWHPEPIRFMTGFGMWKSKAHGVIEWAYMWPVKPDDPGAVYQQPGALLYRFPKAPGESGGPTIAYEAAREGVDDYRYLLTLHRLVQQARQSEQKSVVELAESLWQPVQAKLDSATFEGCKGRAMQGNWTGHCEILPNGDRAVRGDHKIDNNWQFEDYDDLRSQIALAITRLHQEFDQIK